MACTGGERFEVLRVPLMIGRGLEEVWIGHPSEQCLLLRWKYGQSFPPFANTRLIASISPLYFPWLRFPIVRQSSSPFARPPHFGLFETFVLVSSFERTDRWPCLMHPGDLTHLTAVRKNISRNY